MFHRSGSTGGDAGISRKKETPLPLGPEPFGPDAARDGRAASLPLGNIVLGRFLSRVNRFLGTVEILSKPGCSDARSAVAGAHIKDSGRLREILYPGNLVGLVAKPPGSSRRTDWDLVLARCGMAWVSLDPSASSKLVEIALTRGTLPGLRDYSTIRREAKYGESRLDFLLEGTGVVPALLEVKSVTLVRQGVALFPDAPTLRGTRHLRELIRARSEGYDAFVVFGVQRQDAGCVKPNRETDETFARTLAEAAEAGVHLLALRCRPSLSEISLEGSRIPVLLGDG